jgi:hypothetical protein
MSKAEKVRVDGSVEITPREWYDIIDYFTRADDLLVTITKQLSTIIDLLEGTKAPGAPAVSPRALNNKYKVFTVDLTTARTDEPIGIEKNLGVTVNSVTVTKLDDVAYWKRNDVKNDVETLTQGYEIKDYEINELFITNPASTIAGAKMIVVVEWRE